MQRSPELEAMLAADEAAVERQACAAKAVPRQVLPLLLGGAALAYVVVFAPEKRLPDKRREATKSSPRRPSVRRHFCARIRSSRTSDPEPVIKLPDPPLRRRRRNPRDDRIRCSASARSRRGEGEIPSQPEKMEEFPKRFLSKQVVVDSAKARIVAKGPSSGRPEGAPTSPGKIATASSWRPRLRSATDRPKPGKSTASMR